MSGAILGKISEDWPGNSKDTIWKRAETTITVPARYSVRPSTQIMANLYNLHCPQCTGKQADIQR